MKLYELLAKIAKGEVKEGTRIIQESPRCKREYTYKLGKLRLNTFDFIGASFTADELNDEVEIIEPAKDNNGDIKEITDVPCDLEKRIDFVLDVLSEVIKKVNKLNVNEDAKRFG